jgi:hypothetical protein
VVRAEDVQSGFRVHPEGMIDNSPCFRTSCLKIGVRPSPGAATFEYALSLEFPHNHRTNSRRSGLFSIWATRPSALRLRHENRSYSPERDGRLPCSLSLPFGGQRSRWCVSPSDE